MGKEIERKYLVKGRKLLTAKQNHRILGVSCISQYYLLSTTNRSIRVRVVDTFDEDVVITYKSNTGNVLVRNEYEFRVPKFLHKLFKLKKTKVLTKIRTLIQVDNLIWEVDQFTNASLHDLVLAEVELPTPDYKFNKPSWVGAEVTGQSAYYNSTLATTLY